MSGKAQTWIAHILVLACASALLGGAPANDACSNSLPLVDGDTAFDTRGATTDGPSETTCDFIAGDLQLNQDIWYRYESTCTGILTVSLCDTPDAAHGGFDTKVALYLGTECPPGRDPLACDDDGCSGTNVELASTISARVNRLQRYTIRVGGFEGEEGPGTISIECRPDRPECYNDVGDCCAAHASPGCEDPECCELVCEADANCCTSTWDADCSALAADACVTCGGGDGDECIGCIAVRSGEIYHGSTIGKAGTDLSRCDVGDTTLNPDVWHCWRADCSGTAIVSVCDSDFDTTLAVFDQCGGAELVCVDDACPAPNTEGSEVRFAARAGTQYRIRVAGWAGASGEYNLSISCQPGPINDRCANAVPLTIGSTEFSTIEATTDGPDLPQSCREFSGVLLGDDIWYDFTPECSGIATFSTCNAADFDTRLALYEGCQCPVTNDRIAGCNDDLIPVCQGFTSELTTNVTAGVCYKLRVGGFRVSDESEHGTGTLTVSCSFAAPNDLCANAPIETLPHTFTGDNTHATNDCSSFDGDQVWIAFQVTQPSDVTLDYCGTTPGFGNVWLNLATECPCMDESDIAAGCYSCPDGNASLKWFCLPPGTYYYPVLSEPGSRGPYTINVSSRPCASNDACASAFALLDGDTLFKTEGMTTDGPLAPQSCDEGDGITFSQDIWFNYTASCTGQAEFSTCGLVDYDSRIALYSETACPVVNGRLLGCNDDRLGCDTQSSELTANVTQGTAYKVRVGGVSGTSGSGCLHTECRPAVPSCPNGAVVFIDPPSNTVDARQPETPSGGTLMGIDRFVVQAPAQANAECFALCETAHPNFPANTIANMTPSGNGTYTIMLSRPLTPGAVTTLTYEGNAPTTGSFIAHPANVNGDLLVNPADVSALIACLNQPGGAGCSLTSVDTDHSAALTPFDLIRLMDVINGGGTLDAWHATPRPINSGACP